MALRTPTLPPATTTNTLIVGTKRLAVIEPATPFDDQRRELDTMLGSLAAEGAEVVAVLVTHHHVDHVGYADELRTRLGVPLYAHPLTAERLAFAIDERVSDGDELDLGDGFVIESVFTPGHAPGHLTFYERKTGIAHAGDMVAGEGFILIDPDDDGDMAEYLQSLARLRALGASAIVPAHGPVIDPPEPLIDHYVEHRLERERRVLDAIGNGCREHDDVLAAAYSDTPRLLWPLASRSLEAHLRKLENEQRIVREAGAIRPASST